MTEQARVLSVAIVGGGPGCKAIMDMIFAEKLSQLRIKLIGVACTNPKAVGYCYAREKGIFTTRDYRDLYKLKDLNMIIELTGREKVSNDISRTKPDHIRLMGHVAAHVFWDLFQIEEQRLAERKQAQEALQKAHDELEHRVEERTAKLAKTTEQLQLELSERKLAEEMLKETMAKSERSNAELEQFAYVASHDLQEPVRKIQTFGDLLKARYAGALDERGCDYLDRMQNAARRMQALINDLLTLSRITTRAQPFVPVNLADVMQEMMSDLELYIEQTGGRVEVGNMPTIDADPTQMRQLLQNLINNGLKFHHPEEKPVVKVYGQLLKEVCQITVEDNGIGFDEKYLDRIFAVFQRLHGRGKYAGTGLGLAICRKIVERHGGSITAKSTPGQGAKFIVTLPVRQPGRGEVSNE